MRHRNQVLANQLPLFDCGEARLSRDAAIAAVGSATSKRWFKMALLAVKYIAERRELLTTDSVWYMLEVRWNSRIVATPAERRAMGAVMREAVKLGYIELSGMNTSHSVVRRHVESIRKVCHARPLTVWRSLLRGTQARPVGDRGNR